MRKRMKEALDYIQEHSNAINTLLNILRFVVELIG